MDTANQRSENQTSQSLERAGNTMVPLKRQFINSSRQYLFIQLFIYLALAAKSATSRRIDQLFATQTVTFKQKETEK